MPVFETSFFVPAPIEEVAAFHRDTQALKLLTPPPIIVQFHQIESLGEGSLSIFTLWFGPFPVQWTAIHSQVDALHGFTDTQQNGPLAFWQHTHHFETFENGTRVTDHIHYSYSHGWQGIWTRLLFNPLTLRFMFAFRAWNTRRRITHG